jgi:hypothetical protein
MKFETEDSMISGDKRPTNNPSRGMIRKSFQNWLSASKRAKELRRLGYDVSVPVPHLGRPQLILITAKVAKRRAISPRT